MLNRKALIDLLIVVMTLTAFLVGMCAVRQAGYQAGFATAKDLVENSNLGELIRTPDDIRTISGTVTAVNDTRITLSVVSRNPFDLAARTILVASSTEITKLVQKDPEAFQSEMDAFIKATRSGTKNAQTVPPPELFTLSAADLASINVGDVLIVTALENIKSVKEFTAHLIQVQVLSMPSATP